MKFPDNKGMCTYDKIGILKAELEIPGCKSARSTIQRSFYHNSKVLEDKGSYFFVDTDTA